jgi:hypothetical protein
MPSTYTSERQTGFKRFRGDTHKNRTWTRKYLPMNIESLTIIGLINV